MFFMQNAYSALYTNDISNGCVPNIIRYYDNTAYMTARWTPNSHTCNVNQFLPANIDGCVSCPMGQTCTGGTFEFNETETQGITYITPIMYNQNNSCVYELLKPISGKTYMVAKFVRNIHNCSPGYYLPANIDECRKCLNDHYCLGGNLTFNETIPQGIEPCSDAHPFAPAGMWLESQCGRKLHVGDDVLYLHQVPATPTARRLYVRFNDVVYSANATEVAIAPTTMSEYAKRALHVIIDGVEYLIHDDSAK